MSTFLMHLLVFAVLCGISLAGDARPTECDMWEEASSRTMEQEWLNVTCAANAFCTGFHCSGLFLFKRQVYRGSEPFGFAVEFIPCSYPLVMRIRINGTELHFMKMIGVSGRNEETFLLMMQGASGFEEPYGRINMAWNSILKPVKYFVTLQINFTRIYVSEEFLPITIVPLRSFPVPNCQYEPKPEEIMKELPPVEDCEGIGCEEKTSPPEPIMTLDSDFIKKMCIGVSVFLVALCVLLGFAFIRRHRGSKRVQKLEVEGDDSSSEDEVASASSSRSSLEDKKILLRV